MSNPPDRGNRAAELRREITALEIIRNELRHYYATTRDVPVASDLRQRDAELSERIDLARAILDRFRSSGVLAPLSAGERERQEKALADLDQYIRDDESIHTSIAYLMQIASRLRA